ncbi:MAG: hypothetical protein JW704_00735, partial [Anaerolineaceae bacterium]|nr:hypothetical protein [Anaerolineaceae bacterium]
MIKISRDGRKRSVTTWREALSMVDALKLNLTDEEKALVLALYEDVEYGYEDVERDMVGHIFHTEPVSMAQFMEDPYYLGESCTTLYPELHKDLISLFDRPYREVVLTGGIGVGKCVAGDTEIYDPVHGRRMTAAEMAILGGGIGCASYDKNLGGMRAAECSAEASGVKMTGRLKVRSGRSVRLSLDHPVLTPYGWKVVSELSRGDLVASARRLPAPVSPLPVSDDEVKWVAYMLADGGTTTGSMTFTNESLRVLSEFESVTTRHGTGVSFVRMDGKATTLRPLEMQWARKKYNLGKKAIEKRVPAEFYGLDDRQLGLFLNRVWACDGWVCKRSGDHWEIGISLGSEAFIRDIQQLLLRFGINARVRQRKMKYTHKGEQRSSDAWSLQVLGADDIVVFLDSVGMVRGKEGVCQSALAAAGSIVSNSNVDITPMNREVMTRLRKEIGPLPKRAYWPRPAQWSQMGNKVFRVFAANYTLPGWCRW